jgi:CspA family cold shock protein
MVKWFNEQKNYGFIIPDDGGRDLFFHRSDMQASLLREGQLVAFGIEEGKKGPVAVNVTPCDGEGNAAAEKFQPSERPEQYTRSGPAYPDSRPSYSRPPAFRESNNHGRRMGGRMAGYLADAKSICDSAEELALRISDENDMETMRTQMLNLSVLLRTAREKLDDAMDEFYCRER